MKLHYYPDPILFKVSEPVCEFNHELKLLIEEMKIVMLNNNGIGLAAPQVGMSKQIFILKNSKNEIYEFVNPKIIEIQGQALLNEGCLSAPGVYFPIVRPEIVLIQYKNADGEDKQAMAEGVEARTILHEMEHLEGKFYFDKVNRAMRKKAISYLRKTI